jgi:hypothetical protein
VTERRSRHRWDHDAGFELWFGGGAKRATFAEVASHFGVHPDSVRAVAREEDWVVRAATRESAIREEMETALIKTAAERRVESLRILDVVKARFEQRLAEDDSPLFEPTFRDFAEAVKLEESLATAVPDSKHPTRDLAEIEAEIENLTQQQIADELALFSHVRQQAALEGGRRGSSTC